MKYALAISVLLTCSMLCERLGYDFPVVRPGGKCYCAEPVDPFDTISPFSATWSVQPKTEDEEE